MGGMKHATGATFTPHAHFPNPSNTSQHYLFSCVLLRLLDYVGDHVVDEDDVQELDREPLGVPEKAQHRTRYQDDVVSQERPKGRLN